MAGPCLRTIYTGGRPQHDWSGDWPGDRKGPDKRPWRPRLVRRVRARRGSCDRCNSDGSRRSRITSGFASAAIERHSMTKVLIVEDERNLAPGLRANLEVEQYDVTVASTGEAAVEALKI